MGELEAGGFATTGTLDLRAGIALGALTMRAPSTILQGVRNIIPTISAKWGGLVDAVGEKLMARVPKVFRAGRGAPIEFREGRAQMEADIANGIEKAIELGTPLKRDLSLSERLRAEQILRGSITTAKTPEKVVKVTAPIRAELDNIQKELLELGRLSPETIERFQNNFGPYFARLYATKEFVEKGAIIPWRQPVRAGTERLKMRGERVEVEIPSLEKEMDQIARLLGPETEFRREFRNAARELAKRRETITTEKVTENVLSEERTTTTQTTAGTAGEATEIPLSGVANKLETIFIDALEHRGMSTNEASIAVRLIKAAAGKAAQSGPEVKITGGGTTTERITETIKRTVERQKETVKEVIENLGVNKAQKAALHAYYDAISRAGAKAKRLEVGGRVYRIEPVMDIESGLERTESLKPLLDAGYRVEAREGNKVSLFRDIPEEVRKAMGELREQPGYVAAKSIAQTKREIGIVKFFKKVSANPEWTSDVDLPGYTQMPNDKMRLADLAGKFVRSDIAAELNDITRIKADWEKIVGRLTQMWKVGKVTNPGTIGRNFMSSAMLADFGGLSAFRPSGMRTYARTAAGFLGDNPEAAKLLTEAKTGGLFRATFNQQEIANLAEGFVRSREENGMLRLLDSLQQATSKVGEKFGHPTRLYGGVDHFFKGALYIHARSELNLNAQASLRFAKKYGIDYGDISPFVRTLRELPFGAPFATFASKAIPLTIETAIKHPVRFWKWPLGFLGIQELSKRQFDSEREEINKVQDLGQLKSLRFVLLPTKDTEGRFQFLDLGYVLPFGDLVETLDRLRGGEGANLSFELPGGPGAALLEVSFNKSLFSGKPIYAETDTIPEAARKITDHVLKAWLPALVPPIPGTGFAGGYSTVAFRRAIAPEIQLPGEQPISPTDYFGHRRDIVNTIESKILGLNVKGAALRELQQVKMIEFRRQIDELSSQLVRSQKSGITDPQKRATADRITERLKSVIEKAGSEIVFSPQAKAGDVKNLLETRSDVKALSESSAKTIGNALRRELHETMKDDSVSLEAKINRSLEQRPLNRFLQESTR